MRVIVSGAGRGGTNLLTELVRKITNLSFTKNVEDRTLNKNSKLPESYATKLAVGNTAFTKEIIGQIMDNHKDLHIIFSLRHPIDNCLSKIVRGQKASKGGDKPNEIVSLDGTFETSIESLKHFYETMQWFLDKYPNRTMTCKMEDIITDTDEVVNDIASFLNLEKVKSYEGFQSNNRNQYQKGRYGNNLDKSQINLYEKEDCFNGFFSGKDTINNLKEELSDITAIYYG